MSVKAKIILVSFLVVSIALIGYLYTQNYKATVTMGGKVYKVDVSDNEYTLSRGLSGRKSLGENEGMLFVFKKADNWGFWMKEMNFPIDIIWLDENMKIVHIEKSLSPNTYPKSYYPNAPSMYVLEVNAGETDILGVNVGDKVKYLK